jgi:peptidoglycan lytic transglycosylase
MVVAAVPRSMRNRRSHKAAAISTCYLRFFQSRVTAWIFVATILMLAQTISAVSEAADEQTSAIVSENPVVQESQSETPSDESSIPENFYQQPEDQESEIPAIMATPLPPKVQTGLASWYGAKHHGKRTASGERFDQKKLTAAHPTLPWGSIVKVTSLANGKSVNVRINDRGPFIKDRIIDLSRAAARSLGMVGLMQVQLELLTPTETPECREVIQDELRQATAPASNQN